MKADRSLGKSAYKVLMAILPALVAGAACAAYAVSPNYDRSASGIPGLVVFDLLTLARASVMFTAGLLLALATVGALRDRRARRRPTWYLAVVGAVWLGLMLVMEPFFGYLTLRVGGLS